MQNFFHFDEIFLYIINFLPGKYFRRILVEILAYWRTFISFLFKFATSSYNGPNCIFNVNRVDNFDKNKPNLCVCSLMGKYFSLSSDRKKGKSKFTLTTPKLDRRRDKSFDKSCLSCLCCCCGCCFSRLRGEMVRMHHPLV